MNRLFRSAHSLKGLAGLFGFDPIQDLAAPRRGHPRRAAARPRAARAVGGRADRRIGSLCSRACSSRSAIRRRWPPRSSRSASSRSGSRRRARRPARRRSSPSSRSTPRCCARSPSTKSTACARTSGAGGTSGSSTRPSRSSPSRRACPELAAAIREVGEVLSTLPTPGEAPEAQIRFSLLVASDAPTSEVVSRLGLPASAVRLVRRAGPRPRRGRRAGASPAPAAASPTRRRRSARATAARAASPNRSSRSATPCGSTSTSSTS